MRERERERERVEEVKCSERESRAGGGGAERLGERKKAGEMAREWAVGPGLYAGNARAVCVKNADQRACTSEVCAQCERNCVSAGAVTVCPCLRYF